MIKELVVISGKGGTGKTTLMAALSSLVTDKIMCDADVDAADLHLIMAPAVCAAHDFQGGRVAIHLPERCSSCGKCRDLCQWNAIREDFSIDAIACEGCGVCAYFCPEKAIDFPIKTCGQWFISDTRFGPMVHAALGVAEENSGKLVTQVRKEAKRLAEEKGFSLIITDGPPGVGCPVIASLSGATAVLIVSEPTISGLHDMERVLKLCDHFRIPRMVCVNKFDLNAGMTGKIEEKAGSMGAAVVGKIPFDADFTKAMVHGLTLFEFNDRSNTAGEVKALFENVMRLLETSGSVKTSII